MNHEIPLPHVCKALYLLSLILEPLLFSAGFAGGENVPLTDIADLLRRQIDTAGQIALFEADFAGKTDPVRKLLQIGKAFFAAADNGDPVPFFDIGFQFRLQHIHLAAEAEGLPALQIVDLIKTRYPGNGLRERRKHCHILLFIDLQEVIPVRQQCCILRYHLPPFQKDLKVFLHFPGSEIQRFIDSVRIVDHDTAVGHIIPQKLRFVIKIVNIVFQKLDVGGLLDILAKLITPLAELFGGLRALFFHAGCCCRVFLLKSGAGFFEHVFFQQNLLCRVDLHVFQVLYGPLGVYVEGSD